jgi:CheY-like chemotaxis protein
VQGLTLIGLTASTHPDDWQRCIDAGMNGVLTKPLDVPRIVQTIHRHWRSSEGAGA